MLIFNEMVNGTGANNKRVYTNTLSGGVRILVHGGKLKDNFESKINLKKINLILIT